jgi:hypothetical protein
MPALPSLPALTAAVGKTPARSAEVGFFSQVGLLSPGARKSMLVLTGRPATEAPEASF